MPPKLIKTDSYGNEIEEYKPKRKPPTPYIEAEWLTQYRIDRDICLHIINGSGEFSEDEVKRVQDKYFKSYQEKLF